MSRYNAVRQFGELMIAQLRENSHKGHWRDCGYSYLLGRLHEERYELIEIMAKMGLIVPRLNGAIHEPNMATERRVTQETIREAQREAADIANFAMMIYANLGKEKEAQ